MSRKMLTIVGLFAAVSVSLSACGAWPGAGKTYRIGILASPNAVNYWGANAYAIYWDLAVMSPTRLSLFGVSDERFQVIPQVAADWPSAMQKDGEFWTSTVSIKKGIEWSDGKALTAKDVAFTYNTALRFGLNGGSWSIWADGNYLDHVEATDDYTVRFVYQTKPGMARHEWGDLQASIFCEHYWAPLVEKAAAPLAGATKPHAEADDSDKAAFAAKQAEAAEKLYAISPDGEPLAGAFLFSRQEAGSFVENTANAKFFFRGVAVTEYSSGAYREAKPDGYTFQSFGDPTGEKSLEYTSGPNIDKAVYSVYSDQSAALLALKKGEIDFILNPQGLQRGLVESAENDANLKVAKNESMGFRLLAFNTRRAPMDDPAFRQTVALLIDREFLTKTILQDVAFPIYSFVPEVNAAWYYGDVPRWGSLPDGTPMTREERLNQAVDLLESAGYSWSEGGKPTWDATQNAVVTGGALIKPDKKPVQEFELLAPTYGYDPLRATFAIWITQWLNEVGIPAKARLLGFNSLMNRVAREQDFDVAILGSQLSVFPSYLRDFWHSSQAQPGGKNVGGYSNAEFDRLSDQLLTCESLDRCKPIADKIQTLIATDVPWIALFDTGIYEIYNRNLKFPYTDTLGGLQYFYGLPSLVAMD